MAVTVFEFDDFKLDCGRFELYRAGRSLKLERKPMELLILLATRNGRLVTRAEIAECLWDSGVFVDTEHGINTAVRKIRQALRDDIEQPRFLLTVTGKGYRFIGTVVEAEPPLDLPLVDGESECSSAEANNSEKNAVVSLTQAGSLLPKNFSAEIEPLREREPTRPRHSRLPVWLGGFGVAATVAFFIVTSLGAHGWRDRFLPAKPDIQSLAVLPLDNFSGDPAQNYLADGMTEELTTMLAKSSTLRIVSRTSAMQYKGARRPLRDIARELGVNGILEGSVERTGDRVHMTLQVIQAPTDTHVWAESYDRNANDVVALPMEAAQAIAKRLDSAVIQPASQRYISPEAHDAYLRGRYMWFSGENAKAGEYFKRSVELQPDYALGWTGVSLYYGAGAVDGDLSPEDALAQAEAAARKAVELDDSLPEGHQVLAACIFLHRWDWAAADREMDRAIELNPQLAEAYHFRAKMLNALNRGEEAIATEKKAQELSPFQRPFAMAYAYLLARQYDAAIKDARSKLEAQPEDPGLHWVLFETYRRTGDGKDAAEELEKAMLGMGNKAGAESVRRQYERGGYKEVTRAGLKYYEALSTKQYVSPVLLATRNADLGNREAALSLLEEGYRQHSPELLWIQNDPTFDFLHKDERYRAIIRGSGCRQLIEAEFPLVRVSLYHSSRCEMPVTILLLGGHTSRERNTSQESD